MKKVHFCLGVLSVGIVSAAFAMQASGEAAQTELLYRQVLGGTVGVVVDRDVSAGFLVDRERRLVVAHSDMANGRNVVEVFFPAFRGRQLVTDRTYYLRKAPHIRGRVIHRDPRRDLVLIQLDKVPRHAQELPLAKGSPRAGERVHLVGHFSTGETFWLYAKGRVCSVRESKVVYEKAGRTAETKLVNTALPALPIGRGSALVNDQGEVVAIHTGGQLPLAGNAHPTPAAPHIDVSEIQTFLSVVTR